MAKSDFTFVGSPHDPVSVSGSDPHTGSSECRLSVWYKIQPGYFLTASGVADTDLGPGSNYVWKLYDASGNPESKDREGKGRHVVVGGSDGTNLYYEPVISASMVNQGYIGGDNQYFLMGDPDDDNGRILMRHGTIREDFQIDTRYNNAEEKYNWKAGWISGSQWDNPANSDDDSNTAWKGYSQFAVMKYAETNSQRRRFLVHYGSCPRENETPGARQRTFAMGIYNAAGNSRTDTGNQLTLQWRERDHGTGYLASTDTTYGTGFHCVSMRAQRGVGTHDSHGTLIELFGNGDTVGETYIVAGSDNAPQINNARRTVSIGGWDDDGAGYIATTSHTAPGANAGFSALAEWFVFEDAISDVRRQQMERYLADRTGQEMSSSTYLSEMEGGPAGTAVTHSSLSNALGSNGTYARAYYQAATSSAEPKIQHETCGGGFIKSTADSGKFYNVTASSAISLRMHVRAEALNDTNHTGSQVALVAKATSPFGNQIDHIKGYAVKFGTMKDGYDSGNTPSFRLSLRNGDQYKDGYTTEGCGDIDLSNDSLTPAVDTWYSMRIDVIPSGHNFDRIKAWAKAASSGTWLALKDGSDNTYWDIPRDSAKYRYWSDDGKFNDKRVPIQNGTHNGYYVAMSSSTGNTLTTKYYIDGFEAKLDNVT